jgi:hypothetical protein
VRYIMQSDLGWNPSPHFFSPSACLMPDGGGRIVFLASGAPARRGWEAAPPAQEPARPPSSPFSLLSLFPSSFSHISRDPETWRLGFAPWRCRRPLRWRARSPEGERAAVERLGGGALLLSRTPVALAASSSLPRGGKLLRRPGRSWSRIWHDFSIRVRVLVLPLTQTHLGLGCFMIFSILLWFLPLPERI